jgi:hypothetical protein
MDTNSKQYARRPTLPNYGNVCPVLWDRALDITERWSFLFLLFARPFVLFIIAYIAAGQLARQASVWPTKKRT